jgi:molybdopterin converting factor small subunit
MARVFLPSGLSEQREHEPILIEAPRVHELLQLLAARYPRLADLLPHTAIAIDGEIFNDAEYEPLTADSEVHLVPRIAGGSIHN